MLINCISAYGDCFLRCHRHYEERSDEVIRTTKQRLLRASQ